MTPVNGTAYLQRLGLRVKVARTALRMTQDDLGVAAGLDRTYVSRVERGEHNVTVLTLIRIADVLGVPAGQLLDSARVGERTQPTQALPPPPVARAEHSAGRDRP